jgi:drug/metabolite transporter (DMT)-like permease
MRSILFMLLSVAVWSLFPVIGAFAIGRTDVFELIARAWFQGSIAAAVLLLLLSLRRPSIALTPLRVLGRGTSGLRIAVAALGNIISHACLFGSFYYMNKAAATTIFETWPLIVAYVMPMLFKGKFKSFGPAEIIYAMVGFCGLTLLSLDATISVAPPGAESIGEVKPQLWACCLPARPACSRRSAPARTRPWSSARR